MRKSPPTASQSKRFQTATETVLAVGQIWKYFKAMNEHCIVGVTCDAHNCPIGNYLRGVLNLRDEDQVEIDGDWAVIRQKTSYGDYTIEADVDLRVIGWPRTFTRAIDSTAKFAEQRDITAGEALSVLRGMQTK